METRNVIWTPAVRKKLIEFRSSRFTPEETLDFISSKFATLYGEKNYNCLILKASVPDPRCINALARWGSGTVF